MAFCIGMVEVLSYWKAFCPPRLNILAGSLCPEVMAWWRKLYFLGLGEFFFRNGIHTTSDDFIDIAARDETPPPLERMASTGGNLIPVGGGKDSIVSLELLRPLRTRSAVLLLNAPSAARQCSLVAGYSPDHIIEIRRTIDPGLLELNAQGALNGHTPFSALLAFVSIFAAALNGASSVILSNESSANEPTIPGSHVNHQYSKSFEFEQDFREYVRRFITPDIEYFSLLRPLNELQIASLMSTHAQYLPIFKSCNVGSREGVWCGRCPKCLFTYVMLQPFCPAATMVRVFGHDLLDDPALESTIQDLIGVSESKPFDCVGTVDEVRAAISLILSDQEPAGSSRLLLAFIISNHADILIPRDAALAKLREWNGLHNVPPALERLLRGSSLFQ
jgi:hypothetical protein